MREGRLGDMKHLIRKTPQSGLVLGATTLSSAQGQLAEEEGSTSPGVLANVDGGASKSR